MRFVPFPAPRPFHAMESAQADEDGHLRHHELQLFKAAWPCELLAKGAQKACPSPGSPIAQPQHNLIKKVQTNVAT